ncbi:hypothetical protein [Conexibacter sp. CPCC 206217]|uniref:hypothetical protein n=1 Tax=Conexibacter sp. CPCC 206217 TaxID=3064574 RepID=UPI00271A520F|nr:hypothetical protein [Conexibacter sp. CPCC 206217]MDO8210772.1 hypothetical protein [Conexibacter sp. CPCC 206217]
MSDRTPELAVLAVLVVLTAGVLLFGGSSSDGDASGADATAQVSSARLARVERRVEQLRGLRFKRPVSVTVMSPDEVRAFGVAEEDAASSARERAASQELLKVLGLIDPDVQMDAVTASIYGEQVAGFYDPRSERLALVRGVGIDDVTLAHELTHALEDQHFDLSRLGEGGEADTGDTGAGASGDDDAASAESALVEGTATVVMTRYLQRYPEALGFDDALGQLWGASGSTPLPPYVMRSLLFPYEAGQRFVGQLLATSGDWRLVDEALRDRPPTSAAEVLDVDRWLDKQRPAKLALPPADAPGPAWRRIAASTFGEVDLRELLRDGVGEDAAEQLAATWTGGRYALWRRGPLPAPGCDEPCLGRDALVLRLRFDSPAAAGAVSAALGTWLQTDRRATATGPGAWSLPGATAATITTSGPQTTVTLAPTRTLAARLARWVSPDSAAGRRPPRLGSAQGPRRERG